MTSIWTGIPTIQEDLETLQKTLLSLAYEEKGPLHSMLKDLFQRRGKLLRGGFCLIAGQFTQKNPQDVMDAAAALEAFHLATLIHDDIIDGSSERRGMPSAQKMHGMRRAVLLGDFLFSRAMLTMTPLLKGNEELALAKGILHICRQEIRQSLGRENPWSLREYTRRTAGKTAALFSLSLRLGGLISESTPEQLQALSRYGYNLGMAFQIIDDIMDLSPRLKTGKPVYQDMKNGIATLPLILAVKQLPHKREEAAKMLSKGKIKPLLKYIEQGSGLDEARKRAQNYSDRCYNELNRMPQGAPAESLKLITRRCLEREF